MKMFDWIILQSPQYKKLDADYEYSLNRYNKLMEVNCKLIKTIKKIRTNVRKLDKKNEYVKKIKELIKECI